VRDVLVAVLLLVPAVGRAGPFPADGVASDVPVAWATEIAELVRGPQDIADPQGPLASSGSASDALGPASAGSRVVALGDGGWITLGFAWPLRDAPGPDLAIFENGFATLGGVFAELAFIEISSDGASFARFGSTSLTPGAVGAFGVIDPTDVDGLAGALPAGLGTVFDLADLATHPLVRSGDIDLQDVRFVRVVDVIGDGSTFDSSGAPVHDPFPTPFEAGGFDLDAVGVLQVPRPVPLPSGPIAFVIGAAGLAGEQLRRRMLQLRQVNGSDQTGPRMQASPVS
jgi:hypothetical protein